MKYAKKDSKNDLSMLSVVPIIINTPKRFFIFNFFLNFNFFHVFLAKVLNITLVELNRNMHIFYKKKFQS